MGTYITKSMIVNRLCLLQYKLQTCFHFLDDSIEPASLRISANEKGSFKCSFNSSNKTIPTAIFWLFNGIFIDTFPVSNQQFVEKSIDENGLTTITSTMTIVIDSKSAIVLNNTEVECLGILDKDGSAILLNVLTAKLYVQGKQECKCETNVYLILYRIVVYFVRPKFRSFRSPSFISEHSTHEIDRTIEV